jgi:hypothetical protein
MDAQKPDRYPLAPRIEERFWGRVNKSPGQGPQGNCWEWMAGCFKQGYGRFWVDSRHLGAHRLAFELTWGVTIPNGLFVCHSCDNMPCCNPDHLWISDHQGNMDDRQAKGRQSRGETHGSRTMPESYNGCGRGEMHPRAKLTEAGVEYIRDRYAAGGILLRELARMFGVSETAIRDVLSGRTWRTISDEG